MNDDPTVARDGCTKPRRRATLRRFLAGAMFGAATVLASIPMGSSNLAHAQSPTTTLYAILDIGTSGSIVHQVVSIDLSDPANIAYVPLGTIAGLASRYFVGATFDPSSSRIFAALSASSSNTSVDNLDLYSVTFPDLATVTPFALVNTVFVNLNPQATYDPGAGLFYYAVNNDPAGYDYSVNTIASTGVVTVTGIDVSNLQNSGNGLQFFNGHLYATIRSGNAFDAYWAAVSGNATGAITSPITPQPPGQLWSVFDATGVLWGTTQIDASSPPGLALYRLQPTSAGLPASSPFASQAVGDLPTTFQGNAIANVTLFAVTSQAPPEVRIDRPVPATSPWGLAGTMALLGAAAAFTLRRRR